MIFRLNTSVRPTAHRLISLCMVAALLAGIVPLPVGSSPRVTKDFSQPFPCQHHACGCRSAEQCWKKCCCFTNQQKLAWAIKHQVKPPAFVVVAAKTEQAGVGQRDRLCCEKTKPKPTCTSRRCRHDSNSVPTSDVTETSTDVVIASLAQQCRGESTFWNSLPWTIVPIPVDISIEADPVADAWPLISDVSCGVSLRPPVPPPRLGV